MKKNIILFIGIAFLMISCYPGEVDSYDELDLVYTNYTESFDFAGQNTYSMPDEIVKIEGNLVEGVPPEFVKEPYNTQILNKIKDNMSALGWTKVEDPATADLVLFPAVWTNTTVYYYYDYWCWYDVYYCGWGYYYPYVSSYTTGTLVLTLVADGEEYVEPSPVWFAAANGVVSGAYDSSRVLDVIDQAFEQSPYLNTK